MGTYSRSLSLNHISQWEKITGIHLNRVRNLNVSLPATALVWSSSCDVALKDLLIPKNILLSLIFYRWEVSMLSLSNLKDPEFLSFPVCFSSIETGKFSLSSSLTHVTRVPSFNLFAHIQQFGVTRWFNSKESICQSRRCEFDPWVRKIPWRRKWQPTPIFLPWKSPGQRSLVGYSPGDHKRVKHNLMIKQQTGQQFH